MFYGVQLFIEQVHSEFYSKTIDTVIPDPEKRQRLYKALDEMPIMQKKDKWMTAYMQADLGPAYIILPYICVEGIAFQASFTFILWFKTIGKMDNVVFGNIQVRKDEALHRNFGIYKFGQLTESQKPPIEHVLRIIQEAVDLELEFTDNVIPKTIEYRADPKSEFPDAILNPKDIKQYIRLTADHLLVSLGYESHWKVDPGTFPAWLHEIAMDTKNNFYEVRGGNYTQFSLKNIYLGRPKATSTFIFDDSTYNNPDDVDF